MVGSALHCDTAVARTKSGTMTASEVLQQEHLLFSDVLWSRPQNFNKRQAGKILVIAGSRTMAGAALMLAEAAFRTGVGLVTLAYPESLRATIQPFLPEMMSLTLPETSSGSLAAEAITPIEEALDDADLVAIGPGLTRNAETQTVIRKLIRDIPLPLVVDADALNAVSDGEDDPVRVFGERTGPTVLTPHVGEFARLTGLDPKEIEERRLALVREYATDWKSVLVLKGNETLIAEPDGRLVRNISGTPALATAGTGDVLTGIISTLVTQNSKHVFEATATAVYLHGRAGELAEKEKGERGVMATDVIEKLGDTIKAEEKEKS